MRLAPLFGTLAFCLLVTGASALPFLPVRPGHLPPPPARETPQAGFGIADNCYLVEAPAAAKGAKGALKPALKPALTQACD